MITLYHGGTDIVRQPRVDVGRAGLDFGKGFYATKILNQAEKWALRASRQRLELPVVTVFAFDEIQALKYRGLTFEGYDMKWLDFIVSCRSGFNPAEMYDYVEGGVANDRVIDTVEGYINGTVDSEHALMELSKHQPNHQICFLNPKMVQDCLTFKESLDVK